MSQPSRGSEDWSLRVYPVPDSDCGRRVLERWCRDRLESALRQLTQRIGLDCLMQDGPRMIAADRQSESACDWTTFRWATADNNSIGYLSIESRWLRRCLAGFLGERSELRLPEGALSRLELCLAESAIQPLGMILSERVACGIGSPAFTAVYGSTISPFDSQGMEAGWTLWQVSCRAGEVTGVIRLAIHGRIVEEVLVGSGEATGMHDSDDETAMRLDALLVQAQVSGEGWSDLQKGDLVDCQRSVEEPVLLCIEGKPEYWAKLGSANGRRAVQILSAVE